MEDLLKNIIVCDGCKKSWSKNKKMFETAWSGVHWCGDKRCASIIMNRECENQKESLQTLRSATMKERYCTINFQDKSLRLIDIANSIIDEYGAEGYDLTLRQLYYQFVARDIIPNRQSEYNKLGNVINNGRLAGLIDWESIIDRTREYESNSHWNNPAEIIKSAAESYGIDTRAGQDKYIEVWVEKDALVGVVGRICGQLDVGFLSCRGYVSQSVMWQSARRFIGKELIQSTTILHLGDHDPSGIDMTRDIQERMELFGSNVTVNRIALNMDQVRQYNPPPNPAKTTDSRFGGYISKFGKESWELDALDPRVITRLIKSNIEKLTEKNKRQRLIDRQESEREQIRELQNNF